MQELTGKTRPTLVGKGYNLRPKASEAFLDMKADAAKEGMKLYSVSSYRSYDAQSGIWNRKYDKYKAQGLSEAEVIKKITEYSSMPGTSRHHWGTDLDIIDLAPKQPAAVLESSNFQKGGAYEKLGKWLVENAEKYGFYEVYTNDANRPGYYYEPWHMSFKEEAKPMLDQYIASDFKKYLRDAKTKGSLKFTDAFLEKFKNDYILGINAKLK